MTNPVPGKKITTPYGKPGKLWKTGYHVGADYAAPTGTPIVAVRDGKVLEAKNGTSWGAAYGISAVISHGNGIRAIYAHMSKVLVKAGDVVIEGQKIGEVGSTGNSTGPHLHLETRVSPWRYNNKDVDPDALLNGTSPKNAKESSLAKPAATATAKTPVSIKKPTNNDNKAKIETLKAQRVKAKANGNETRVAKLTEEIKNLK